MSDPSAFGFGQFVPGFDFLQNLSKTASPAQAAAAASMPGIGNWVAPTLSIEDIDKRIQELKSVLFWLEQNTTALKATIQAMEVQKMTNWKPFRTVASFIIWHYYLKKRGKI